MNPKDAMKSPLLSMTEKAKMAQFTLWASTVRAEDPKTWVAGTVMKKKLALDTMDGAAFWKYWPSRRRRSSS